MKICFIAPLVGVVVFALSPATIGHAAEFNPKEISVNKSVPWQKSKEKPGQGEKTIASANPRVSPTPGKPPAKKSAGSTKPGGTKQGSATSTEISAASPNSARRKPGRATFSNIVLERGSRRGPTLSANPGATVSPVRATTNVKLKEANRMSLPHSKPTASATPRPAVKK